MKNTDIVDINAYRLRKFLAGFQGTITGTPEPSRTHYVRKACWRCEGEGLLLEYLNTERPVTFQKGVEMIRLGRGSDVIVCPACRGNGHTFHEVSEQGEAVS